MIEKISLKNFRQHKDTVLEFVQGVNTIVGANNSGKSTIPEAIEFALYGSRALRDNAKGFVRDGQTSGSAVIKLGLGKDILTVGRNTKNAEVRLNGNLEARYKENVSEYISSATGVSQIGFRLGHYIRQKELSYFSSLRPGKRFELIEKMLKINAVDVAIKNVKRQIIETDINTKVLLAKYKNIPELQEQLDDKFLASESASHSKVTLQTDLLALEGVLVEQRKELLDIQHIPEYNSIVLKIIECERAEKEISEIVIPKLTANADALYDRLKELTLEERVREELDSLVKVEEPTTVEAPDKPSNKKVIELRAKLRDLTTEYKQLAALDSKAVCPTCQQALGTGFKNVLENLSIDLTLLKEQVNAETLKYDNLYSEYETALMDYNFFLSQDRAYSEYIDKKENLLKKCTEAFSKQDKLKVEKELDAYNKTKEEIASKEATVRELTKLTEQLPALKMRERELEYVVLLDENPELEDLIATNEEIERDLNLRLNKVIKEEAFLSSSILSLQADIKEAKAVQKEMNVLALRTSELKNMRDNFILFKRFLTAKIRPMLQKVAETLFHKTTKERYAGYELSEDYDITLITHTGFRRKLASISGSENDLASLCLRLAIATLRSTKLAGSLGFIILDEISGSFDDERTKQTLEGLLELKSVIPQIINITHKPVEMKYADKLFTVTEDNALAKVTHLP